MIQFSPDTEPANLHLAGGHSGPDTRMEGFCLTHYSGAGCADFQAIALLPTTKTIGESPALFGSGTLKQRFLPAFDHARESTAPADYRVTLDPDSNAAIDVGVNGATIDIFETECASEPHTMGPRR